MTRRITSLFLICAFVVALAASGALGQAAAPAKDGKALFTEYKCNTCHTITSQAIVKKEDKSEESDSKSKKKPPDLSAVGKKRTAVWMTKYLNKLETIDKEKHSKKFKGTEAELKTLTTWLETLKSDKKS